MFIDDASLIDWHSKMKVKMPQVFPEDDKVFGDDPGQHPYGTKLLAHFDDDPNKPMHATVLGSRWKRDDFASGFPGMSSPFVHGLEPMYTILMNGGLSQIGLMDAHMGDDGGWKVVGHNSEVNARLDALARAHQNINNARHDAGNSSDDSSEDGVSNYPNLTFDQMNVESSDDGSNAHHETEDSSDDSSEGGITYPKLIKKSECNSDDSDEIEQSVSDYPDITFDEYKRTLCAAHRLQECPICCMSFVQDNEDIDGSPSDRE